jgi:aminocarboxymuconate-semialdehyde decarboxylase
VIAGRPATVDVHAHVYPQQYLEHMSRLGARAPNWSAAPLARLGEAERIELLDRAGIDRQVLSIALMQPYLTEPGLADGAARLVNDLLIGMTQRRPESFRCFVALPLPHWDAALAELDRCLSEPGVVGVTIGCSVLDRHLDDPAFGPLWAELDRRRTVVFLHPVMRTDQPGLDRYDLDRHLGALFEDTVAAVRLVKGGVVARYPGIRFVVAHLGGTLPFVWTRVGGEPDEGYGRLWFDTASSHAGALRCACSTPGPERLVFGTDYPYLTEAELGRRPQLIDRLGLSEHVRAGVLGATAMELFGPDAPA